MEILLILAIALSVDILLGELPNPLHPVVWMGKLTSFLEKGGVRGGPVFQFVYGLIMTLLLTALFGFGSFLLLGYLGNLNTVAYSVVAVVLLKSAFSLGTLGKAALRIKKLLEMDKLEAARSELRWLVSRDTQKLSREQVVSATVESVAENICDSFVAPLFYFLFFGIPGALAYRVVNTLDAMIGYRGKYEYLGKFAARFDDVLNYIPARLSALLLVKAAFFIRRGREAWRGAMLEHAKTESPNAGWTMAAAAGALGVQLEKIGHYRLGKPGAVLEPSLIDASVRLVGLASFFWIVLCFVVGGVYFALTT